MHIDDRLARQLLYHLLRNVAYSKNTSDEMKSLLFTPELISAANQFHRVDECGKNCAAGGDNMKPEVSVSAELDFRELFEQNGKLAVRYIENAASCDRRTG